MYHLNRRFIDEKVLQQYYFEKFMTGDATDRRKLLPKDQFFSKYALENNFKVLHPEVKIRKKGTGVQKGYIVDFVLYSRNNDEYIYIEMKFGLKSLNGSEDRKLRHPLLRRNARNGRPSGGFAVVLVDDCNVNNPFPSNIPVVTLDFAEFAKWYLANSIKIVDQLRSKILPEHTPIRKRPSRNWVVYIGKKGSKQWKNYQIGKKWGRWAFPDSKKSKELLNLEVSDRIVFVEISGFTREYNRKLIAWGEKDPKLLQISSSRSSNVGNTIDGSKVTFRIEAVDIFELTKGYHTNFEDGSFEEDEWKKLPNMSVKAKLAKASSKEYTQYVEFNKSPKDEPGYLWGRGKASIDRKEFAANVPLEKQFIDALRESMNSQLPKSISDRCLYHIRDKLE